jgi:maleate isomerase
LTGRLSCLSYNLSLPDSTPDAQEDQVLQALPNPAAANNGGAYGATYGLVTPMGNPCAEPELAILTGAAMLAARATSPSPDSRTRLSDYIGAIGPALASFDQTPLAAAGFACTCYYLRGPEAEAADIAALEARFGYPVITSTLAIRAMATAHGIRRLALIAPYPAWLFAEARRYYAAVGLDIVAQAGLPQDLADTRGIYRLTPADVARMAAGLDVRDAEAVLIGGTGMPSLSCIAGNSTALPMFSSNLALAAALLGSHLDAAGRQAISQGMLAKQARWRDRLALWGKAGP